MALVDYRYRQATTTKETLKTELMCIIYTLNKTTPSNPPFLVNQMKNTRMHQQMPDIVGLHEWHRRAVLQLQIPKYFDNFVFVI